jgi:hypothetical protein
MAFAVSAVPGLALRSLHFNHQHKQNPTMNRLRPIDTTNLTINAQLFFNETIIESQVGIGIYDG